MFYIDSNKFNALLLSYKESGETLRKKAQVSSRVWFAAKLGVKPFRPHTINKIATALNIDPRDIVCGEAVIPTKKAVTNVD